MKARIAAACLLVIAALAPARAGDAPAVLETFAAGLPGRAKGLELTLDREAPRVGLAAARFAYELTGAAPEARWTLPAEALPIPGAGRLSFAVRGDGSGRELLLVLRRARASVDKHGNRRLDEVRGIPLPPVTLEGEAWREVTVDLRRETDLEPLARDEVLWWHAVAVRPGEAGPGAGHFSLDEFLYRPGGPGAEVGVTMRRLGRAGEERPGAALSVALDARNAGKRLATLSARFTVTDRNENEVSNRQFEIPVAAGEAKEVPLELAPEDLSRFVPPFRIEGDVLSPEVPGLSARFAETVVLPNSHLLFETFGNVEADWTTRGRQPANRRRRGPGHYTLGEYFRINVTPERQARIERIALSADDAPGPYGMRVVFTGDVEVMNNRVKPGRYFPGHAVRAGFWLRGDGSGALVSAVFHDYSDMADFWPGGWKKTTAVEPLARLDFEGWRYVEVELPGRGLGRQSRKGSTEGIDFPIELASFAIQAPKASGEEDEPFGRGEVILGPVHVQTQQPVADTLAVFAAYDDPDLLYAAAHGATVSLHNGSPWKDREVQLRWSLADRHDEQLAAGAETLSVPAASTAQHRLALGEEAGELADALAPLRLRLSATDSEDPMVNATTELVLARPDSRVVFATFEEADRGYLGLKANGVPWQPAPGRAATHTTTAQAHGGERSLALPYDRAVEKTPVVSLDPPLPGVPTEVRCWVYGDGSEVFLYPVIGDRQGINTGLPNGNWDILLARPLEGPEECGVVVDWTGWREVRFRLPSVPPSWNEELPVRAFVPSYPLGLHFGIRPGPEAPEQGTLYLDDVVIETHLPPAERLALHYVEPGISNVVPAGGVAAVEVANHRPDREATATVRGSVEDWRGRRAGEASVEVTVPPGERRRVVLGEDLPPGFYLVRASLHADGAERGSLVRDLLVGDPAPVLGEAWQASLQDAWSLRRSMEDRFELIDEDWDWLEYFPGNFQSESALRRLADSRAHGGRPHLLLGYAAYWAAGVGLEMRQASAFERRRRFVGGGVDVYMPPERLEDWENYIHEVMRSVGPAVDGWVMWRNPESSGPIGVPAERLTEMLRIVERWRSVYAPEKPVLLGDLSRETALPYLEQLAEAGGGKYINGVNVRMDVGRTAPEDARVVGYGQDVRSVLGRTEGEGALRILYTDLDWAVEKAGQGLDAFDQAAYLARAQILLNWEAIDSTLSVTNDDFSRLGLGLAYRRLRRAPPLREQPVTLLVKPGWWSVVKTRRRLAGLTPAAVVPVADLWPGRTHCRLYRDGKGRSVVALWRNDALGAVRLPPLTVQESTDALGGAVAASDEWLPVGRLPIWLRLAEKPVETIRALPSLEVRDEGAEPHWSQRVLLAVPAGADRPGVYARQGGEVARFAGRTADGRRQRAEGMRFKDGGTERLTVTRARGSGLALRKVFLLEEGGQRMTLRAGETALGTWDLTAADASFSGGMREAVFVLPAESLPQMDGPLTIEVEYEGPATSVRWVVHPYGGGAVPLTALGALHAEQNVEHPRWSRNIVGGPLRIGEERYPVGIGVFAQSLLEYVLAGRFARFTATVGVDAVTEGRGSVAFAVHGDGKKLWSSRVLSGLDEPVEVDVDVRGVRRLRLIVTDAGDGNRFDAADWCQPALHRP